MSEFESTTAQQLTNSRYELHTRFVGGNLKSVRLHPPLNASTSISKADEWTLDMKELEDTFSEKTRILVSESYNGPIPDDGIADNRH